ncbi:MAG: exopolysaccharide biosynthesis polyprenyl glycosylphosphotransferase [Blautia sp.]|nr:exopolysaccharide biosynthesis polyprenyl glycosylphosphotransferase [Blautia sp.]
MSKREDYKRFIVFCLASVVVIASAALFAYLWYGYYRKLIFEPFWRKGNWVLIAIYALIYVLFAKVYGGLRVGYQKKIDIFYSLLLTLLCTNVITYFQITLINRWFLPAVPMVQMTFVQIILVLVWIWTSQYVYAKIYRARKLLVIYGKRSPEDMVQKIKTRKDKYEICEMMHIDLGKKAIQEAIKHYEGVIIWDLPAEVRNYYLKYCFDHSIRCYISPKISDIIIDGSDRIHLFDTPLLLSRNHGLSVDQRALKRAFDILVSGIGIVVVSPLFLLISFMVWAYDRGPVFYRQDRLTTDGREFHIWKFRSMCANSELNGARLAAKNDSRITPVGKVLRNLHLDELPQLFNVFVGDMSLVGPRPERGEIMAVYEEEIPEFHYRLKVKAGLTGYAQVYGKYNTTPYDKLKLDLYYIENYSFMLDIKLILMTVKIFFQKDASEGIDTSQINALKSSGSGREAIRQDVIGKEGRDDLE